jgi:hypothetical protein
MPPRAERDDAEPDQEELAAESVLPPPISKLIERAGLGNLTAEAYSKPGLLLKSAPHLGTQPLVFDLHPAELQLLATSGKFRSDPADETGKTILVEVDPLQFHCLTSKLYFWSPTFYKPLLPDGKASVCCCSFVHVKGMCAAMQSRAGQQGRAARAASRAARADLHVAMWLELSQFVSRMCQLHCQLD